MPFQEIEDTAGIADSFADGKLRKLIVCPLKSGSNILLQYPWYVRTVNFCLDFADFFYSKRLIFGLKTAAVAFSYPILSRLCLSENQAVAAPKEINWFCFHFPERIR